MSAGREMLALRRRRVGTFARLWVACGLGEGGPYMRPSSFATPYLHDRVSRRGPSRQADVSIRHEGYANQFSRARSYAAWRPRRPGSESRPRQNDLGRSSHGS